MEQLGDKNMPPDYKWELKEIMEIDIIKSWQLCVRSHVERNGSVCKITPSHLNLLAVKEKSADMSFWNEG